MSLSSSCILVVQQVTIPAVNHTALITRHVSLDKTVVVGVAHFVQPITAAVINC